MAKLRNVIKKGFKCKRCGWEWTPINPEFLSGIKIPNICPHCKSALWNVRKNGKPDLSKALRIAEENQNSQDLLNGD